MQICVVCGVRPYHASSGLIVNLASPEAVSTGLRLQMRADRSLAGANTSHPEKEEIDVFSFTMALMRVRVWSVVKFENRHLLLHPELHRHRVDWEVVSDFLGEC